MTKAYEDDSLPSQHMAATLAPLWALCQNAEVRAVLHYLDDKATELARIFKRPQHHYLEQFSLGSTLQWKKQEKTNAWSARVHFKGIKYNSSSDRWSKMVEIINDRAEYSSLMEEEKEELVKEFDEVKKCATNRPPNITPRVKATEGTKASRSLRMSKSDFQMAPKAYFTSPECEQFTRVYLQCDAACTATDFESVMLSKGLLNSAPSNHKDHVSRAKLAIRTGLQESLCEVTNDTSATVEFMKYEASVVHHYHVKLMGWNHPQWANPSDLKGGVEALKRLADAIKAKTCHFVEISAEEVEERRRKMTDLGAVLTPETEPPTPLPTLEPLSNSDTFHTQVTQPSPSLVEPDLSSHPLSEPNTLVDTSHITDDLIDPVLHTPSDDLSCVTRNSRSAPNDTDKVIESTLHAPRINNHRHKHQVETDENEEPQPRAKRTRKLTSKQVALEEEARERSAAQGKSKSRKKNT
ncbi:hypothetical protein F4604DRAFT_1942991 [Suillus subluteus]|nr:hypothetical protein F4604DRAFT_1942991 [Suillus subluteus]